MSRLRTLLREAFELPNNVLSIEDGCNQSYYEYINQFLSFAKQHLQLDEFPSQIIIVAQRYHGLTTGAFFPSEKKIFIYGKNRALVDIIRTLAHELTHFRQLLQNKIKSAERDWNLEAEADIEAGKMVYTFARVNDQNMIIYDL